MQIFKFVVRCNKNVSKENQSQQGKYVVLGQTQKDDFVNVLIKQELTDLYLIQIYSLLAIYYKVRYGFFIDIRSKCTKCFI